MSLPASLVRRQVAWLRSLFRGGREDAEAREELRFHLEMETEQNLRAGLDPREARRRAHVRLGGVEAIREAVRDARGGPMKLRMSWLDLKLAGRMLSRYPGLTLVGGFSFAFAIAVAAMAFEFLTQLVYGTGKTTTVGKLAHRWRLAGERPLICAADTFRAAAVPQLDAWAVRARVDVVKGGARADPASVVFDAVQAGRARGCSPVVVDTAGRLHTRGDLMAELGKIRRVAGRAVPGAPHDVLLVLDATVGRNGLVQARRFLETAGVTGVVLTKLDGTAKGGVAVAVAAELDLPIRFVGVGEGVDDLLPFSAADYVDALFTPGELGDGRS